MSGAGAPDLKLADFRATIRENIPEAEEIAMTIAEQLHQEGRTEGRAEMLLKMASLKFGTMTAQQRARLESASDQDLDRYAERILTVESLDAVLAERE